MIGIRRTDGLWCAAQGPGAWAGWRKGMTRVLASGLLALSVAAPAGAQSGPAAAELEEKDAALEEAVAELEAELEAADGDEALREELEDAVTRARDAADDAWRASRAIDRAERRLGGGDPTGFFFGAGVSYAAENFDDGGAIVKSALAGSAFAGYRFHPLFAFEVRFEGFDDFDLQFSNGDGEIDGYAITANAKLYPLLGPIQPFITTGIGGIRLDSKTVSRSGITRRDNQSDFLLRVGGGVDFPVNEHLVVNLEAAYLAPGDDLSDLEMTVMGGGLTFRF